MNPLTNRIIFVSIVAASLLCADEPRVQDVVLDDHKVYSVPVSGTRVTTISFPSPIAAIDGALVTADGKTPAAFQVAHTKGTAYFSVRALVKDASTNLNVRWNNRTYVFELRESLEPWYSVMFQSPPEKHSGAKHPLTTSRLLGLLDKAKAYPLLQTYHPAAVAKVEHRDLRAEPSVSDCGDYAIALTGVFRFPEDDTVIFQVTVTNHSDKLLQHSPERLEVHVGDRVFTPSLTDLTSLVAPEGTVSGYVAVTGGPRGERNDLSLKNDFTLALARIDPEIEAAVNDFKKIESVELPK
ncbi:MAG: TrbG/VirB9 family P-type conjugative transfer protein [Chthoniobacteraceae bacterium]